MIFNFNYILKFICNYIFISLPQSFIIIALVLLLLKEYEYFKKSNFKSTILAIMIIAGMQTAFFTNYLFYFTSLSLFVRLFFNILIGFIFVNIFLYSTLKESAYKKLLKDIKPYDTTFEERFNPRKEEYDPKKLFRRETNKYIISIDSNGTKFKYKNKVGIFLSFVIVLIALYSLEIFTNFYLQYVFHIDMNNLTSSNINTILVSYPTIIILAFCVYLGYVYVNTGEVSIINILKQNKKFRLFTGIQYILTFIISVLVYIFIIKDNLVNVLDTNMILKVAMLLYLLLISEIFIPWVVIYRKEMLKYRLKYSNNLL